MKRLVIGNRRARLIDEPDPIPEGDWVLIKVHAAPLCTEYKAFISDVEHKHIGHEGAGEVVAVDWPGHLKVGDRVVIQPQGPCGECELCRRGDYIHCTKGKGSAGHLAQYITKPSWLCPKIPDDLSYEKASLACCALGPQFQANKRMNVSAFDTVLITGAGPVGLGALTVAKFRGACVIIVESVPWRVNRAKEMGADYVLDPSDEHILQHIRDLTNGSGVDKAIDCSGNADAERLCIDSTKVGGWVTFIGENGGEIPVSPSRDFIRKGLNLSGVWHYNLYDFPDMLKIIQQSPIVDRLISHVFPMSRAQEALELSASHNTAKIILKPWEY